MSRDDEQGRNANDGFAALDDAAIDVCVTVRDWLRVGVEKFTKAQLSFGHGTANAVDEAAYLILHTLQLPIDELDPFLDRRLSRSERERVMDLFRRRIETRKPASYLTHEAWIKGHRFYVDERVIVPRSYIGELLVEGLPLMSTRYDRVTRVLDLCTGSGCLAILAALAFPEARVVGSDLSEDALHVACRNVKNFELEERIDLVRSDIFDQLGAQTFDLILTNPPYVSPASIAKFPLEYRAEPEIAHAGGGDDGLDIIHRIIRSAGAYLTDDGEIVVEVGFGKNRLESIYDKLAFFWIDTETSEGEVFSLPASELKRLDF